MAISFTPEQYGTIKTVADRMGSGNENFKSALTKKYGEGAYESYLGYKAPVAPTPAAPQTGTSVAGVAQGIASGSAAISTTPAPIAQQKMEAPIAPVSTPTTVAKTAQATTIPKTPESVTTPPPNIEKTTTTTPEGTTTIAKETPGVVTPDYNVGKGREQDILNNLNEGYKQDPAIQKAISTGDYNTFKQAYGYDTADQTKKTMLDAFFQSRQPKNSESFFQTLTTGQKIENAKYRESGEARDAQHRYDIVSPYKGASVDTLYNGMNSGIITPGSKAYKDLIVANGGIETPEMIMAKQKLETKRSIDKVNEGMRAQSSANKGELPPEKPDATETISNKIVNDKGQSWADKFKEMVQGDTETKELADKIKTDSLRKKEIERIRADIFKNIVKNNPGMTMGAANLKAKYESEGFDEEYNNLIDTLNVNSADLRYKTSLLEKAFDFDYKEAQQQEERAYQAQQAETQFGRQKELAQFQQDLALSGNQAEFEQKLQQQTRLASDPYTAISTVMDEYKKMGVPFDQGISTKVADANAFIASGGTIGQYVDKMIKDIKEKKEYKAIQAEKFQQKPISLGKDSYIYDPATGIFKSPISTTGTEDISVTSGTTRNRPDRNNNPGNVKIGDVGYGVDDQNHTIFGDAKSGYNAMVKDITAKLTGGSSQKSRLTGKILSPTSTLADLGSVYAEDPKWSQSVARLSGYPTNTQLSNIDVNVLAPAIAKQEGFTGSIQQGTQGLSPSAQSALNSKTILGDKKKTEEVATELSKAGVFDKGEGNKNYYVAPPKAKAEIPSLINLRDKWNEAQEILKKYTPEQLKKFLGPVDQAKMWSDLKAGTNMFYTEQEKKDYATLDTILGTEMAAYMKNISGATVSQKERETLMKYLPNFSNDETNFFTNLSLARDAMNTNDEWFLKNYGFDSFDKVKELTLGKTSIPSEQSTQTTKVETPVEMLARLRKAKGG